MKPRVSQVAGELGLPHAFVDVAGRDADLARRYGIQRVPVTMVVDEGRVLMRVEGAIAIEQLRHEVNQASRRAEVTGGRGQVTGTTRGPDDRPAGPLSPPPGGWQISNPQAGVAHSPNFMISAPSTELANQVAARCEECWQKHWFDWVGTEAPSLGVDRPQITIRLANHSGGGVTQWAFPNADASGMPQGFVGTWEGKPEKLLEDVVPHEVMHIVTAVHLQRALPRWLDEGISSMCEGPESIARQYEFYEQQKTAGKTYRVHQLFAMREYPNDPSRLMSLYCQGLGLTEFLHEQGGKRQLMEFARLGGTEQALHQVYRIRDCHALEGRWLEWLRSRPRLFGRGERSEVGGQGTRQLVPVPSTPPGTPLQGVAPEPTSKFQLPTSNSPLPASNSAAGCQCATKFAQLENRLTGIDEELNHLASSVAELRQVPSTPPLDPAAVDEIVSRRLEGLPKPPAAPDLSGYVTRPEIERERQGLAEGLRRHVGEVLKEAGGQRPEARAFTLGRGTALALGVTGPAGLALGIVAAFAVRRLKKRLAGAGGPAEERFPRAAA